MASGNDTIGIIQPRIHDVGIFKGICQKLGLTHKHLFKLMLEEYLYNHDIDVEQETGVDEDV